MPDKALIGRISLGSALVGWIVSVGGTVLVLYLGPGSRLGPSEGSMHVIEICLVFSALLHLVALVTGLEARRAWTGIAGAVISAPFLALAGYWLLLFLKHRLR
jgi:hypothetical protein